MTYIATPELRKKVLNSFFGAYTIQLFTTGLNFISKIILARLILPEEWGLFTLSLFVISAISVLWDLGLRSHLMREHHHPFGNVLLLQFTLALTLFILLEVFAPLLCILNEKFTSIIPILRLLAPVILFSSIASTAEIYLDRNLIIERSILPKLIQLVINFFITVSLAYIGLGVWSLVWGMLISTGIYTILIWNSIKNDIDIQFTLKHSKSLIKGSSYLFSLAILGFVLNQVDVGIIGGLLTLHEAGLYSMATLFILKPSRIIEVSFSKVIVPLLTEVSDDIHRLAHVYSESTLFIYSLELSIYSFIFFYPETVVLWLLGEQWLGAVPILRLMSFYAITQPYATYGYEILKVLKKDKFFTAYSLASAFILVFGGILLTSKYGVFGTIVATYLSQLLSIPIVYNLFRSFGKKMFFLTIRLIKIYIVSFGFMALSLILSTWLPLPKGILGLIFVFITWAIVLIPFRKYANMFSSKKPNIITENS